jgi:hypothetical protein
MYNIIERYIKNLSKDQINNFALKNNIQLSGLELDFLYVFIKKNYKEVLANPSLLNIDRYKTKFSEENFVKIKKLFNEYLTKYGSYL